MTTPIVEPRGDPLLILLLRVLGIAWSAVWGIVATTHLIGGSDHAILDVLYGVTHAFIVQFHLRSAVQEKNDVS